MKIIAKEIVGPNAISMQSGQLLYKQISKPLISGETVEIDFQGVEFFASPFFNASIGFLIQDIKISDLQKNLKITNLSEIGRQLLNLVISNAIKFYDKKNTSEESLQIIIKNAEGH